MGNLTKVAMRTVGLEVMNQPPYSPDLAPTDFLLFRPRKIKLGREADGGLIRRTSELAAQSG